MPASAHVAVTTGSRRQHPARPTQLSDAFSGCISRLLAHGGDAKPRTSQHWTSCCKYGFVYLLRSLTLWANPAVIRDLTSQPSRDTACSGIVSHFDRHPSRFEHIRTLRLVNFERQRQSSQQRTCSCKYCFDNLLTTPYSNPTTRSQSSGTACSGTPFYFEIVIPHSRSHANPAVIVSSFAVIT